MRSKSTQTVWSPFATRLQTSGPPHAPPHPTKLEPSLAAAVSVIAVPTGTVTTHAAGQSMPAGDDVTRPWPVPVPRTLMRALPAGGGAAENAAETSRSESS